MKDYIELDCDLPWIPWIDRSYMRVYRNDRSWPAQISIIRKDVQTDLSVSILLRRGQVVELRDFLDSVLKETEREEKE